MPNFYAVRIGKVPGIYSTWADTELAVKGHSGAQYKKFKTLQEAEAYLSSSETSNSSNNKKRKAPTADPPKLVYKQPRILSFFTDTTGDPRIATTATHASTTNANNNSSAKMTPETSGKPIVVYTDGAASNNGKDNAIAGIGVYFGPNDPRNTSERLEGHRQTNQRAEITAALRALELTRDVTHEVVEIRTDSQYVVKAMTQWIHRWKHDGWKVNVMNKDLFQQMDHEMQGRRVVFVHVPGHNGEPGNEAADRLAVQATSSHRDVPFK